jgi:signal transduction histidine kinase
VYFAVREAIQNAMKHGGPRVQVAVTVADGDGTLRFEVADDGPGLAPGTSDGFGLVSMRDRLGAIGGSLEVSSAPGRGTRILGRVAAAEESLRQPVEA